MILLPFLAILLYGALHSLMAAFGLKHRVRSLTGDRTYEGFYRLFYNSTSALLLLPVVWVMLVTPATIVWQIPAPWSGGLFILQSAALLALTLAVLQADPLRFAGVRQALAYFRHEPLPLPPEKLQIGGFYNLVRHPLYLFSLLLLWPTPVMTDTFLGFAIGATLYFVVGSRLEEKRLVAEFGHSYIAYQKSVPWLFPWPRPRTN
ncbi:methyltransferase family protein [Chloroflexota bacterium]